MKIRTGNDRPDSFHCAVDGKLFRNIHPVSASFLRRIKGSVGAVQRSVGRSVLRSNRCHADAARDPQRSCVCLNPHILTDRAELFAQADRTHLIRPREHRDEFVSAAPRENIASSSRGLAAGGDRLKHLIACKMSILIIVYLDDTSA